MMFFSNYYEIRYCDCSCLVDAIVSIDHVTVKKNSFLYVRTGFTSLDGDFIY